MGKAKNGRGKAWTAWETHLVRRKWLAGRSTAVIAAELKRCYRKVSEVVLEVQGQMPEAAGGVHRDVIRRRQHTATVLLTKHTTTPKTKHQVPLSLRKVNAAVREVKEWKKTSYSATSRDAKAAGGRRVLRSSSIVAQRKQLCGDEGEAVREAVADACSQVPRGRKGRKSG